jgi:hypothetical protein
MATTITITEQKFENDRIYVSFTAISGTITYKDTINFLISKDKDSIKKVIKNRVKDYLNVQSRPDFTSELNVPVNLNTYPD